jgi:hypothetical protein
MTTLLNDQAQVTHDAEIRQVRISEIMPSPANDQLYRPVSPADPDVIALADSIREHGVREPLVVTLDNYILSGHRRHMAARIAGLSEVPCRYEDIYSDAQRFLVLLREYNRQRVKTFDEIVREEVVSANPEEAHRVLVEYRRAAGRVEVPELHIAGEKRRAKISKAKQPFLDAIKAILERLRDFWPLSVRQIHYNLLNDPPLIHASKPGSRYRNTQNYYKSADELLVRARFEGLIPFEAIQDKTRSVVTWTLHKNPSTFIRAELDGMFKGYYRDLMQSQTNHIEIIGEKNTIEGVIRPVAEENCIPYTLGRGYASVPPRRAMAQRFRRSGKERLFILVLSDFDPEGEDIPHAFARSMRDDLKIPEENIGLIKVGLTLDQVRELQLPPQTKAKETSSRYAGFVDRYGDDVYELESAPPEWLQQQLRDAIDGIIDIDAFNQEIEAEKNDAAHLDAIRRSVLEQLRGLVPPTERRCRQ